MTLVTKIVRELDRCIFCNGTDMTEEHLIADWAHRAFARARRPTNQLLATWVGPKQLAITDEDPVLTAKVICRPCNNEWISGIDKSAAEVLKPLIRGEREVFLDSAGQAAVAAWIYKSALIFDAADNGESGDGCIIYAGPATRPPLISAGDPPIDVRFWLLGIRPAVGTMNVVVNVSNPDGSVTPGTPTALPIPGYQIMVGALWAYLGGQIPPVTPESLDGFGQVWPAQSTPVMLRAASLADPPESTATSAVLADRPAQPDS